MRPHIELIVNGRMYETTAFMRSFQLVGNENYTSFQTAPIQSFDNNQQLCKHVSFSV